MPNINVPEDDTFVAMADKLDVGNAMLTVIAGVLSDGQAKPTTWAAFKQLVKSGNADKVYSVGDVFIVERATAVTVGVGSSTGISAATINMGTFLDKMGKTRGGVYELIYDGAVWKWTDNTTASLTDYGISVTGTAVENDTLVITETTEKIAWMIIGFDQEDGIPEGCTHSVTFNTVDLVIKDFQFDAAEALYYCETALPAGTYNITLYYGAANETTQQDGTYQFTTTQQIPAGGGIRHSSIGSESTTFTKAQITSGKFTTYSDLSSGTTLETNLTTTEGSGGTNLGTFTRGNPAYGSGGNCNLTSRSGWGSGNYADSDARMWINSPAAPGAWWSKSSKFDLPSVNKSLAGFLYGLDKEFVEALSPVTKRWQKSIADGYGLGEVTDKMFILALPEVYAGIERLTDGPDGYPYTYYSRFSDLSSASTSTDTNRIKYYSDDVAYSYLLRTARAYQAPPSGMFVPTSFRMVTNYGNVLTNPAAANRGISPACVIAA